MKTTYLTDFKGGPALLICTNAGDLNELSNAFEKLAGGVENWTLVDSNHLLVNARCDYSGQGLKLVVEKDGRKEFSWTVSAKKWKEFSNLVLALAESAKAAHQYLEVGGDDATVIVSTENYDRLFRDPA